MRWRGATCGWARRGSGAPWEGSKRLQCGEGAESGGCCACLERWRGKCEERKQEGRTLWRSGRLARQQQVANRDPYLSGRLAHPPTCRPAPPPLSPSRPPPPFRQMWERWAEELQQEQNEQEQDVQQQQLSQQPQQQSQEASPAGGRPFRRSSAVQQQRGLRKPRRPGRPTPAAPLPNSQPQG